MLLPSTRQREIRELYLLANTVIFVLSPDAKGGEAWELVDRLTKEADGSDDVTGSGELLRNLSVSMVSTGKSDSGLPLVMLLFTPRPEEAEARANGLWSK